MKISENNRPPNIVLTIADDQRFDLLGALGRTPCRTPALDRLAARGTWYTRAHTMGSTHGAVCAPSRAMLHTGWSLFHLPNELRMKWGWSPDPPVTDPEQVPLLGELLRRAGYCCFATGKWHNGARAFARSFDSGARIFFGGMSDQFAVAVQDFDPTGRYGKDREWLGAQHSTELFAGSALEFLRGRSPRDRQPFFLYCAFTAPHDPRTTLPEWHARYRPEDIELTPNFLPEHPFDNGELKVRDENLAVFPRDPAEIRRHIADYYAMTAHMDDAIGRIHRAVAEAGLADQTIVVHTADHGLAVGQHGLLGKQNLYGHSVRVPLIIAGPGFEPGRRDDRLCYLHDLFPTLLNAAGVPVPASCEFTDLRAPDRRATLFATYRDCQRMVRDERWKLIEYYVAGTTRTQLFDLEQDPWETCDRAADPRDVRTRNRLAAELRAWRDRLDDPLRVCP